MRWDIIHTAWPALVPLAACLITAALTALGRHAQNQRELHDLLRQTAQMRYEYIESLPAMERHRIEQLSSKAPQRFGQDKMSLQPPRDAMESPERQRDGNA